MQSGVDTLTYFKAVSLPRTCQGMIRETSAAAPIKSTLQVQDENDEAIEHHTSLELASSGYVP